MRFLALFCWPIPLSSPDRSVALLVWLYFRCLPALAATTIVITILSASVARSAEEMDAQQWAQGQGAGHLLLRSAGSNPIAALATETRVHFDISGLVAVVELEQTFINTGTQWAEGVYGFPLPGTAAVRYMEMIVGERRVIGKVRERQEARKRYEKAKQAGKKASLVEQQRPNLFTSRIANIAPGERVTVKLEYVQSVDYRQGEFSLRFPMTITPRYIPGEVVVDAETAQAQQIDLVQGWGLPTDQVADAHLITPYVSPPQDLGAAPLNPAVVTASLDMGLPLAEVSSLYHEVQLQRDEQRYSVELVGGVTEMDRDFVLHWRPVVGGQPQVALFTEEVDGQHYGLLMALPPAHSDANVEVPREVIFVIDTSGSMGGVAIDQAKLSVSKALQQLHNDDYFNVIEFNSTHRNLYQRPMRATRHYVQRAQEFVRQLHASGGTEMMPALREALHRPGSESYEEPAGAERLRQIIFITDGAVGNESALYGEIASGLGDSRLFTVGIGSAPNSWFMRKAADIGRGTHTHIGATQEVGQKMDRLLSQLQQPALIDIAVSWQDSVESWPEFVPDLYAQEPVILAVHFGAAPPMGELEVTGTRAGQPWRQVVSLPDSSTDAAEHTGMADHNGVASLWARRKIEGLLDQKVLGADPDEIKAAVLDVALPHQLLSPYTSFVAIEEVVVRPDASSLHRAAVPNSAPHGQAAQVFAYPRTATTGPARLYLGLLLLFVVLMARVMRQEDRDA